ncbi:MAG: glycosyltransferase family 2 protein [Chitinophagales bacterium]
MKLTIVIVNYNVKYFLEQCLLSVQRAVKNIAAEVYVVDNASADGSVELVQQKFPWVKCIANKDNGGFSKANNQAMQLALGEYVLLLNPDTVVAEDTFEKCLAFMDAHADAGALGVHMIDGRGNFLPESKRGLPRPAVAFYKTFGLAALFPKSRTFGQYHLGFLPEHETNEVEILSGAFMFMRKAALDKTGLLDETFFMYGEDVDLSYRIVKAGYKNYYFADTTIIHYKGESTKKGSLNYVKVFYNAMIIFARKHFSGNQSGLFSLLINFAIVFRGALTLVANLFASSYLFIIDALLAFGGIYFITDYWEKMIKYREHYYPMQFLFGIVPVYIAIWLGATYLSGGYDKPFRISRIIRGVLVGTLAIAAVYAFLPDDWRFSRAIILLGAAWMGIEMLFTRTLYHLIKYQSLSPENEDQRSTLLIGNKQETSRAEGLLRATGYNHEIISSTAIAEAEKTAAIYNVNELVFCAEGVSFKTIIENIIACGNRKEYKILNEKSNALIGSNSKDTAGDIYTAEKSFALFKPENLRGKRVFDIAFCLLAIPLLPLNLFLIKNFGAYLGNWFNVLTGTQSWVGFSQEPLFKKFPHAKRGVLSPADEISELKLSPSEIAEAEVNYARHYSVNQDIRLIFSNYKLLGK